MIALTQVMRPIAQYAKQETPGNAKIHHNVSKKTKNVMAMKTVKTSLMKKTAQFVEMVRSGA